MQTQGLGELGPGHRRRSHRLRRLLGGLAGNLLEGLLVTGAGAFAHQIVHRDDVTGRHVPDRPSERSEALRAPEEVI